MQKLGYIDQTKPDRFIKYTCYKSRSDIKLDYQKDKCVVEIYGIKYNSWHN